MKNRNEQGYVLLVVLLVVVFIMTVSASFVAASVSNAKQERTVDTNNLAVVAAEMGVDYYKTVMINEFNNKRDELITLAQTEINNLIDSTEYATMTPDERLTEVEKIRKKLGETLEGYLDIIILNLPNEVVINNTTKFKGNNIKVDVDNIEKHVLVNGSVIGSTTDKNPRELKFELEFKFLDLSHIDLEDDLGEITQHIDFDNIYPGTDGLLACGETIQNETCIGNSGNTFGDMDNSTIYYPDGYNHPNSSTNNKDFNGSKIYSDGDIDVKNMNGMSNVSFFVNGDFNTKNLLAEFGVLNSNIIVNGSMEGKNVLVTNSRIMLKDNLYINGKLNVHSSSKVCIGGKATFIGGDIVIDNSSNVYVANSYFIKQNENGSETEFINSAFNNLIIVSTEEELWDICTIGTGETEYPPVDDDWNEPIISVDYE